MAIAFIILTLITLFSALMVIFENRPVYSVLYLVLCFFSIAGHYILLNADFLALVQIIVYAGAVMVLFLFVVMMLNLNKIDQEQISLNKRLIYVIGGGSLLLILLSLFKTDGALILNASGGSLPDTFGTVNSVGLVLFQDYMIPFEFTSILFISAMVGAVILGKKHIDD